MLVPSAGRFSRLVMNMLLLSTGLTASAVAQEKIHWFRSAEQAAIAAEQAGKPIMVYVRSASCHYCDLMQRNVWDDPTAARLVMSDFIPLKLTREENAEEIASLKIKGYPATLIFGANRSFVGRIDGYVEPTAFKAAMVKARSAKGPTKLVR